MSLLSKKRRVALRRLEAHFFFFPFHRAIQRGIRRELSGVTIITIAHRLRSMCVPFLLLFVPSVPAFLLSRSENPLTTLSHLIQLQCRLRPSDLSVRRKDHRLRYSQGSSSRLTLPSLAFVSHEIFETDFVPACVSEASRRPGELLFDACEEFRGGGRDQGDGQVELKDERCWAEGPWTVLDIFLVYILDWSGLEDLS